MFFCFVFPKDNSFSEKTTLQLGFVPSDSTINQLVDIYKTFAKHLMMAKMPVLSSVLSFVV